MWPAAVLLLLFLLAATPTLADRCIPAQYRFSSRFTLSFLKYDTTANRVLIEMKGVPNFYFGLGFGHTEHSLSRSYTVLAEFSGGQVRANEWDLGSNHGGGSQNNPIGMTTYNSNINGEVTVGWSGPLTPPNPLPAGTGTSHYTFDPSSDTLVALWANGGGARNSFHSNRGGVSIKLTSTDCANVPQGFIDLSEQMEPGLAVTIFVASLFTFLLMLRLGRKYYKARNQRQAEALLVQTKAAGIDSSDDQSNITSPGSGYVGSAERQRGISTYAPPPPPPAPPSAEPPRGPPPPSSAAARRPPPPASRGVQTRNASASNVGLYDFGAYNDVHVSSNDNLQRGLQRASMLRQTAPPPRKPPQDATSSPPVAVTINDSEFKAPSSSSTGRATLLPQDKGDTNVRSSRWYGVNASGGLKAEKSVLSYGEEGGFSKSGATIQSKQARGKVQNTFRRCLKYRIPVRHLDDISAGEALLIVVWIVLNALAIYLTKFSVIEATGYLSIANALLCVVPSTRNSILVWLFGMPFDHVVVYHRWLGRCAVLLALLHTFLSWNQWRQMGVAFFATQFTVVKYHYGFWASFAGVVLYVTSLEWFRRNKFQWFFWTHFAFFLFFAFSWLHSPECEFYVLASAALYGLDRLIRLLWGIVPVKSLVFVEKVHDVVQVRFPKHLFARALGLHSVGQYFFVSFPTISLTEFHPFSVSSGPREKTVEVHIRALGDHTGKVLELCKNSNGRAVWMRVDGPYGHHDFNYRRYPFQVLAGGGIGIAPIIGALKDMYNTGELEQPHVVRPHVTSTIYLIWVMKQEDIYEWFRTELAECMQKAGKRGYPDLTVWVYVSQAPQGGPLKEHFMIPGRPNFKAVYERVYQEQQGTPGITFACGPGAMIAELWDLCNEYTQRGCRFDFHHETFDF